MCAHPPSPSPSPSHFTIVQYLAIRLKSLGHAIFYNQAPELRLGGSSMYPDPSHVKKLQQRRGRRRRHGPYPYAPTSTDSPSTATNASSRYPSPTPISGSSSSDMKHNAPCYLQTLLDRVPFRIKVPAAARDVPIIRMQSLVASTLSKKKASLIAETRQRNREQKAGSALTNAAIGARKMPPATTIWTPLGPIPAKANVGRPPSLPTFVDAIAGVGVMSGGKLPPEPPEAYDDDNDDTDYENGDYYHGGDGRDSSHYSRLKSLMTRSPVASVTSSASLSSASSNSSVASSFSSHRSRSRRLRMRQSRLSRSSTSSSSASSSSSSSSSTSSSRLRPPEMLLEGTSALPRSFPIVPGTVYPSSPNKDRLHVQLDAVVVLETPLLPDYTVPETSFMVMNGDVELGQMFGPSIPLRSGESSYNITVIVDWTKDITDTLEFLRGLFVSPSSSAFRIDAVEGSSYATELFATGMEDAVVKGTTFVRESVVELVSNASISVSILLAHNDLKNDTNVSSWHACRFFKLKKCRNADVLQAYKRLWTHFFFQIVIIEHYTRCRFDNIEGDHTSSKPLELHFHLG